MMQKRIQAALDLRKAQRDPFRAENGYSWDYVLVFKVMGPDDKITEKQKNPSRTLKGIVLKLAEAGLQTKLFYSVQVSDHFSGNFFIPLLIIIPTRTTKYIARLEPH